LPDFQIIEARRWHVGQMVRILRKEHIAAAAKTGFGIHEQLAFAFNGSSAFRRAWLIDGKLAGLGGVIGTLSSGQGIIWLALSDQATKYPRAVVREAKAQIAEIMQTKSALFSTVAIHDKTALKFASFLGFEIDHNLTTEFGVGIIYRGDNGI
jgi:hypothetical protein